jgi:hypothetical protein
MFCEEHIARKNSDEWRQSRALLREVFRAEHCGKRGII